MIDVAGQRFMGWLVLIAAEAALATTVGAAFWLQDWQYSLPTPQPASLQQPAFGSRIELPELIALMKSDSRERKPTLLHFFNPECPCSRFNAPHLRELCAKYGDQVHVVAVLETDDPAAALRALSGWGLNCPALVDERGDIARRAGVYSTPQAIVLDPRGLLYYRGNYNLTRYCTGPETEFVRRALDACLSNQRLPDFPAAAILAQGCPLPSDALLAGEETPR